MKKVGFIGMGNMGYAMLSGVLKKVNSDNVSFIEIFEDRAKSVSEELNVSYTFDYKELVEGSDFIVLAIKPQMLDDVAEQIRDYVTDDLVVLSILPGVTIDTIKEKIGGRVVRSMPNTPAMVGEGMTAVSYDESLFDQSEIEMIDIIYSSIGKSVKLPENLMNAAVCANGSSPAYVFMFIEALADSVVKYGIKRDDAYTLVAQTVLGSAKLMLETKKHPGELKDMVCSPGGTTIAAVEQLESNGLRKSLFKATQACYEKSESLK